MGGSQGGISKDCWIAGVFELGKWLQWTAREEGTAIGNRGTGENGECRGRPTTGAPRGGAWG